MDKASHCLLMLGASFDGAGQLRGQGFEAEHVESLPAGLERLRNRSFDCVLLNLTVPDKEGLDAFARIHTAAPHVPIVVVVPPGSEAMALVTLELGAQDYLLNTESNTTFVRDTLQKAIVRHQGQEASRRDRHLLEILMDKIPDAIYFKDADSRFLRINRAHARRFSLVDPGLAIGKLDADFFTEAHAQQARVDEQRVMQTGLPLVGIEEMETWPDGTISWVSTTKMPLRDATGRIIGTFGISRDITARKEAELALDERTQQLRRRNQQVEEELKMARELQRAMLPQQFPCILRNGGCDSAVEFFSFYDSTGTVSGDFFDVIELSDTAVGMFICDVMGHDVRAALVTAMMRSLVEDLSPTTPDPGQLLTQINRVLAGIFRQTGATMFATALYLIADVARGEVRYASAAHPDALHLRREHRSVETLLTGRDKRGPALGLFEEALFPTCRRPLDVGDLIMLFTDGLIEAEGMSQEYYTLDRLATAVRRRVQLPARDILQGVIRDIRHFCGGGQFGDDVSVLGMEVKRLNGAR